MVGGDAWALCSRTEAVVGATPAAGPSGAAASRDRRRPADRGPGRRPVGGRRPGDDPREAPSPPPRWTLLPARRRRPRPIRTRLRQPAAAPGLGEMPRCLHPGDGGHALSTRRGLGRAGRSDRGNQCMRRTSRAPDRGRRRTRHEPPCDIRRHLSRLCADDSTRGRLGVRSAEEAPGAPRGPRRRAPPAQAPRHSSRAVREPKRVVVRSSQIGHDSRLASVRCSKPGLLSTGPVHGAAVYDTDTFVAPRKRGIVLGEVAVTLRQRGENTFLGYHAFVQYSARGEPING